jgi:hypothetical protein
MSFGKASSLLAVLVAAVALTGLGACSGQGEGQLCSLKAGHNGGDDCQSGLTCTKQPASPTLGRCCPLDPNTATTDVCAFHGGASDAASPNPPGASTETSTGEAGIDGTVESSSDAPMGADASDASSGNDANVATGAEAADATPSGDASDATSE